MKLRIKRYDQLPKVRFTDWEWGDMERTKEAIDVEGLVGDITDLITDAIDINAIAKAAAKDVAEIITEVAEVEGAEVWLWEDSDCDDQGNQIGPSRATLVLSFPFLTTSEKEADEIHYEVQLATLLEDTIVFDPNGARSLIPVFEEMLAKLKSIPSQDEKDYSAEE